MSGNSHKHRASECTMRQGTISCYVHLDFMDGLSCVSFVAVIVTAVVNTNIFTNSCPFILDLLANWVHSTKVLGRLETRKRNWKKNRMVHWVPELGFEVKNQVRDWEIDSLITIPMRYLVGWDICSFRWERQVVMISWNSEGVRKKGLASNTSMSIFRPPLTPTQFWRIWSVLTMWPRRNKIQKVFLWSVPRVGFGQSWSWY